MITISPKEGNFATVELITISDQKKKITEMPVQWSLLITKMVRNFFLIFQFDPK